MACTQVIQYSSQFRALLSSSIQYDGFYELGLLPPWAIVHRGPFHTYAPHDHRNYMHPRARLLFKYGLTYEFYKLHVIVGNLGGARVNPIAVLLPM